MLDQAPPRSAPAAHSSMMSGGIMQPGMPPTRQSFTPQMDDFFNDPYGLNTVNNLPPPPRVSPAAQGQAGPGMSRGESFLGPGAGRPLGGGQSTMQGMGGGGA